MDRDKRAIIVKEILYWRKSKLLPEQYCDFLLNLYGAESEVASSRSKSATSVVRDSKALAWCLGLGLISIISIIALNFNVFPLPLQIVTGISGIVLLLAVGIRILKRSLPLAYLSIGAGCLLMLFVGEWLLMNHGMDEAGWAIGYLAICCVLWMLIGIILRLGFLHFCGWVGILLVYGWLLMQRFEPLYGIGLQAGWIAIAVLFLLISWVTRRKNQSLTRVFLLVGILGWLAPEVQSILLVESPMMMPQAVLVGKIMLAGLVLFVFRKQWIEWVA